MKTVECITLNGQPKPVPVGEVSLRPAAYAILLQAGKLLVVKLKASGKYHLPGGGMEAGERSEDCLRREVREETGIEIRIDRFAFFEELFFYYDPSGRAYHGLHFYYFCEPLSLDLLADAGVDDASEEQPRWAVVESLRPSDFQHGGEQVLAACAQALGG